MVRTGGKDQLEEEIDALFRLPLAEFTSERNTLAARLKKEKRINDAERVKLLGKPSISAWAVNQLYWEHRDALDRKSVVEGKSVDRCGRLSTNKKRYTECEPG